MARRKNILFIMCDQLRYDYLSCAGHKTLHTPNIDKLAQRGVRFTNAYAQSPICGPSRMSFYTGRYVSSHGATGNFVPLRVGEHNIGDHLKPLGMRTVLVGKTHMVADQEGMQRLGLDPQSQIGVHHAQAGFEPFERDDGVHPDVMVKPNLAYNAYLKQRGYAEHSNPWHWAANSVKVGGEVRSGFFNDIARQPAIVDEQDSETTYMTRRAMEFMESNHGETPWLLHLSFIKPHWPYIAPAPYNDMYGTEDIQPVSRSEAELKDANPFVQLFQTRVSARSFSREEVRETVVPVYMGLIKQIDDQLGVLFSYMEERALLADTMIVFTSDHGDYLGDHWMGDKDFFHEEAVKVPLIIVDPDPACDATRGSVEHRLVEAVDLLPTFIEFAGGEVPTHIIDGRSLAPLLRGEDNQWREYVISEYDYFMQPFNAKLQRKPLECRSYMIANARWKYIHAPGYPPMLFDLQNDPNEYNDLGRSAEHRATCDAMHRALADWAFQYRQRTALSEERAHQMIGLEDKLGVLIGYWNEDDIEPPARAPSPNNHQTSAEHSAITRDQ